MTPESLPVSGFYSRPRSPHKSVELDNPRIIGTNLSRGTGSGHLRADKTYLVLSSRSPAASPSPQRAPDFVPIALWMLTALFVMTRLLA